MCVYVYVCVFVYTCVCVRVCVYVCVGEFPSGHLGRPAKIRGHPANGERGTSQKHEHAARRARTAIPLRSELAPGLYVWADGQGPSADGGWPFAGVHWEPHGQGGWSGSFVVSVRSSFRFFFVVVVAANRLMT